MKEPSRRYEYPIAQDLRSLLLLFSGVEDEVVHINNIIERRLYEEQKRNLLSTY